MIALAVILSFVAGPLLVPLEDAACPALGASVPGPELVPPNPAVHGRSAPSVPREEAAPLKAPGRYFNVLVLLVDFQDTKYSTANSPDKFRSELFNTTPGVKSANNYYYEISYGKFNVTGEVTAVWYTSAYNMSYYGKDGAQGIDSANGPVYRLVTEAVRLADPDVDFSKFDLNNDKIVDHLCVVHAGQGQESSTNRDCIWSHRWYDYDEPAADGVHAGPYTMLSEFSPVGVFVHEFGHDIGLPDLYDYGYDSFGAGVWDVMATGSWQDSGNTPVHPNCWSKMKLGWLAPVDIAGPETDLGLLNAELNPVAYRIWISPPNEYFLIENRQKLGFDMFLPSGGVLIWHIDESVKNNDDQTHRLVDLEEADEATNGDSPVQSTDPWRDSESGFNPASVPNTDSYQGFKTGWWVFKIGASGNSTVFSTRTVDVDLSVGSLNFKVFAPEKVAHTIRTTVYNLGSRDQTDVPVICAVYRETAIFTETKRISISTGQAVPVHWTWTPPMVGNYIVTVSVQGPDDAVPENNDRFGVIRVCALLFFDDVENGTRGWTAGTSVPLLPGLWHIANQSDRYGDAVSATHSWWCGYDTTGQYRRGTEFVDYTLESPIIDLTQVEGSVLSFQLKYDISSGLPFGFGVLGDSGYLEVSTNLGSSWTRLDSYTGDGGNWSLGVYDISNFTKSMFKFRFVLKSNVLMMGRGWYVDDLAIYGVGDVYDAGLALLPNWTKGSPRQALSFNLTVSNAGNLGDTFELSWEAPESLSVSLSKMTISLGLFESGKIRVVARITGNAEAGTTLEFKLKATSRGNPRVVRSVMGQVRVLQEFALELESENNIIHGDPGDNLTFSVNVTNLGNGRDTVILTTAGKYAGMSALSDTNISMRAWETKVVQVILFVPSNATASSELSLGITARSSGGPTESLPLKAIINRTHGVSLSAESTKLSVKPGSKARFTIFMKNTGNGKEDFVLTSELPKGWTAAHDVAIPLGPWTEVQLTLEVTTDRESTGGSNTVVLKVSSPGGASGQLLLTVEIVLPDLILTQLSISPQLVDEGDSVTFRVTVRNDGTGNASTVTVYIYDNGKKIKEWTADRFNRGDAEMVSFTLKLSKGRHILSAVAATPDREISSTNNEVQGEAKVRAGSSFIPGFGGAIAAVALLGTVLLSMGTRRRNL